MDVANLIAIVQEYDEIYNLRNPYYSNIGRRDNIWEEIGKRMNQSAKLCKDRWTKTRDNFRRALLLRKTKSGQATSKLKPSKFEKELSFLLPYLEDEQARKTSLSPVPTSPESEEHEDNQSLCSSDVVTREPTPSPMSDTPSSSAASSTSVRRTQLKTTTAAVSTASVLQEYITTKKEAKPLVNEYDPLTEFFVNMAHVVKTFPLQDQINIKKKLFENVTEVETKLAGKSTAPTCQDFSERQAPTDTEADQEFQNYEGPTSIPPRQFLNAYLNFKS